ncbi:Uncharacterised protein [Vibrio cholerae]|nr:Uncharacterised protein [Vibrio cholerae]
MQYPLLGSVVIRVGTNGHAFAYARNTGDNNLLTRFEMLSDHHAIFVGSSDASKPSTTE